MPAPLAPWAPWARLGVVPSLPIALGCTALLALGAPPGGTTWLVWISFIPLALMCKLPQRTAGTAFLVGWFGGLGAGMFGFFWVAELLERFAQFPPWLSYFSLFVFSAWTAVQYGLWGLGVRLGPKGPVASVAWAIALWVALATSWPALFPYTAVLGLAEQPVWIQAAEIGGTPLVEAQILAVGVLVADAILDGDRKRRLLRVGSAAAVFLLSTGLGAWRMNALDEQAEAARHVVFGVVQPNTPLKWGDRDGKVERLRGMSHKAQQAGAQVVVWPEAGVYPYGAVRPFTRDFDDPRKRILQQHQLPTIFGAPSKDPGSEYGYNTVFNMDEHGQIHGYFDKVFLMPFGEYIPIADPNWAKSIIPALNHNLRGTGPARFEVRPAATQQRPAPGGPFGVGPLICYEDIFPGFARQTAALDGGIEAFVNLTIDTWFGDTMEPWEHLALAQFRSVEHRIPMVRSVSAGPSTVVDHNGRVIAKLGVHAPTAERMVLPEVLVQDVALPRNTADSPTVYALGGWLLTPACQVGVVMFLLAGLARRRYRRAPTPQEDETRVERSKQ